MVDGTTYLNFKHDVPQRDELYRKKKYFYGCKCPKIYGVPSLRCRRVDRELRREVWVDLNQFKMAASRNVRFVSGFVDGTSFLYPCPPPLPWVLVEWWF